MIAIAVDDEILMLGALEAAIKASPDITEVAKFSDCEKALEFVKENEMVKVVSYQGNPFTVEENKAHFTLWAMMAAPLILGNDIRDFIKADGTVDTDNKILEILTNKDVIAIDQDKLGIQCSRVKTNGITDVLVKPLENNDNSC